MNQDRFVISDELWAQIEPLLPGKAGDPGRSGRNNRLFMEAVLWRARIGCPWRDVPKDFGNWNTIFKRFRRVITHPPCQSCCVVIHGCCGS